MTIHTDSIQFMTIHNDSWKFTTIHKNSSHFMTTYEDSWWCMIINRPGVAGAVLQTPLSLINSLTDSWFVEISSVHLHYQTITAREMKFWEKVHLP